MNNTELFNQISTILQDASVEKIEITKGKITDDGIILTIKCYKSSFEAEIGINKTPEIVETPVVDELSERVITAVLEKKNVFAELSLTKEDKYLILKKRNLNPSDYFEQFWK